MISSLLHLVGLRPRVYYTLTNFRGGGVRPTCPPPSIRQCRITRNSRYLADVAYDVTCVILYPLLAYEPGGLTMHPPQNDRGWVHFFSHGCLVPPIFFPKKEVDFVGDIRIGAHQNLVLRQNH